MSTEAETDGRILIIDDEEPNVRLLTRILNAAGFTDVHSTTDPRQALPMFRELQPSALLLDLRMPHLDGFAVMRQIVSRIPTGEYFPILVVTGEHDADVKRSALAHGAKDFLTKPYDSVEVVLRVRNLLETRELNLRLERRAAERAEQLRVSELEVAERLALTAELRDYGGGAHTWRVGRVAAEIARQYGLEPRAVELIERAAPLHDLGKIGIPDSLLLKPGGLSLEEMDVLKTHTSLGGRILSGGDSAVLQMAEEIALYHHENWDGTGYTPGLGGDSIPLAARIVAVADVYDALTHDRPYKAAWAADEAADWILSQRGQKFDPRAADAFAAVRTRIDLPLLDDMHEWRDTHALYLRWAAQPLEPRDPGNAVP
ncbi:MAG: HD domain-containing phosphohydrolase [Longimicrobiales bacterium]